MFNIISLIFFTVVLLYAVFYRDIFQKSFFRKPFVEQLPEVILKLDIDTTRFYEYIWAIRSAQGLDTGSFIYNIAGSHRMKIEKIKELFDESEYTYEGVFNSSFAWRAIVPNLDHSNIPDLYVSLTHYNPLEPYALMLAGDVEEVKYWEEYFLEKFQAPTIKKIATVTGIQTDGSLRISHRTLQDETGKLKSPILGIDDFYPFIEGGLEKLVKDFEEASESTILLIGQWGTGKTSLIRYLVTLMNYEHFGICNNESALESPDISDWISNFEDKSLIAIEDADNFVKTRAEGNKQMSGLLNLCDGIMQTKRKIVISTNLPNVNSIDPALIRPGRTYKVIEFRKLTIDEANKARMVIGLEKLPEDSSVPSRLTLAEALNYERTNNVNSVPKSVVGFK